MEPIVFDIAPPLCVRRIATEETNWVLKIKAIPHYFTPNCAHCDDDNNNSNTGFVLVLVRWMYRAMWSLHVLLYSSIRARQRCLLLLSVSLHSINYKNHPLPVPPTIAPYARGVVAKRRALKRRKKSMKPQPQARRRVESSRATTFLNRTNISRRK